MPYTDDPKEMKEWAKRYERRKGDNCGTRTVENFDVNENGHIRCEWCLRRYDPKPHAVKEIGAFTHVDGCGLITARIMPPPSKELQELWAKQTAACTPPPPPEKPKRGRKQRAELVILAPQPEAKIEPKPVLPPKDLGLNFS